MTAATLMLVFLIAPLRADQQSTTAPQPGPTLPTTRPSDVVDPELVRRLLGGQSTSVDTVDQTLAKLDRATDLLTRQHDAGARTQEAQQEVIAGLDKLIEEARKSRAASRGGNKSKRRREERSGQRQSSSRRASGSAAPHPTGEGEGGKPAQGPDADKKKQGRSVQGELTRGWGFLPQRDREEIAQGFDEQFMVKYREEIKQYYRTLAEQARMAHEND